MAKPRRSTPKERHPNRDKEALNRGLGLSGPFGSSSGNGVLKRGLLKLALNPEGSLALLRLPHPLIPAVTVRYDGASTCARH